MIPLELVEALAVHGKPADQVVKTHRRRVAREAKTLARQGERDAFNRALYLRAMMARHRLKALRIEPGPAEVLVITLAGLTKFEQWVGTEAERRILTNAVALAGHCVTAALAHPHILEHISDPSPVFRLTAAEVAANPPVRLRFEEASVIGELGTALSASESKNWGPCVGVEPVPAEVAVDRYRVSYWFHETSRYNRRFMQRRRMKAKLPRPMRKMVRAAFRSTKGEWVKGCTEGQARVIRERFDMDPGDFWRAARGAVLIEWPRELVQGDLFAGLADTPTPEADA